MRPVLVYLNTMVTFYGTFDKNILHILSVKNRSAVAERSKASVLDLGRERSWVQTPAKEIVFSFVVSKNGVEDRMEEF